MCLIAVFLCFLAQSGVFTFAEAMRASVGQSAAQVNLALEFCASAGIAASVRTRRSGVRPMPAARMPQSGPAASHAHRIAE